MEKRVFVIIIILLAIFVLLLGIFAGLLSFNLQFKMFVVEWYNKATSKETPRSPLILFCEDNEPTVNYFSKGVVTLHYKNGASNLYPDFCVESTLMEVYCDSNNSNVQEHECETGCYDGACILPSEETGVLDEKLPKFCRNYRITSPLNAIAQNEYGSYSALNAIDGDATTRWFGDPLHPYPKWIYFDFAEKVCISELDIYSFSQDLPINGNIQASNDAIRWENIMPHVSLINLTTSITFPNIVTARYIRWFEISSNRSFGELSEVRFKIADLPKEEVV